MLLLMLENPCTRCPPDTLQPPSSIRHLHNEDIKSRGDVCFAWVREFGNLPHYYFLELATLFYATLLINEDRLEVEESLYSSSDFYRNASCHADAT